MFCAARYIAQDIALEINIQRKNIGNSSNLELGLLNDAQNIERIIASSKNECYR
jgi:hypothetical protein